MCPPTWYNKIATLALVELKSGPFGGLFLCHSVLYQRAVKTCIKELEDQGVVAEAPDVSDKSADAAPADDINLVPDLLDYKTITTESDLN